MRLEIVGQTLYQYFLENRLFKILLPFDKVFLLGSSILNLFSFFIDLGEFVHYLLLLGFLLGILLSFAKSNYLLLTIGFGLLGVRNVFLALYILLGYREFPWSQALLLTVSAVLMFQSYKKSLKINLG